MSDSLKQLNENSIAQKDVSSLGGYVKYVDGRMEQWGRATIPGGTGGTGSVVVELPQEYSNVLYNIAATPEYAGSSYPTFEVSVQALTQSTFAIYTRQSGGGILGGVKVHWRVTGTWK